MITANRRSRAIARIREDILEAAARAFSRAGFHSATMRDIAREAGYTAASLYTYFSSKQKILDGLVSLVTTDFLKGFDEPMPAGLTFEQRAELLLRRQLAQAERRRELFVLFMALRPAAEYLPRGRRKRSPFWPLDMQVERFARWFRENATPADLGGHDPKDAALFVVSIAHGFLIDWIFNAAPHVRLTDRATLILDLFFHGVSGARARKDPGATTA